MRKDKEIPEKQRSFAVVQIMIARKTKAAMRSESFGAINENSRAHWLT